jgi:hypothetical protein
MLTLNLLWRVPFIGSIVSPYVGVGFGAALPHTEVDIRGEDKRTYEYQYAGPTIQALFGIEFRIPYVSYFVEYKFTSADYKVPLQNRDGSLLPFDLWNQFQRWWSGKEPEGGWASTKLTSHQVISGFGYRTTPAANALP